MRGHAQFQVMCALAASGQLGDPELQQLRTHAEHCTECTSRMVDFASIGAQALLPQLAARRVHKSLPTGLEHRFAARALAEGIALSRPAAAEARSSSLYAAGAIAMALVLAWIFVGSLANPVRSRNAGQILQASGGPQDSSIPGKTAWPRLSNSIPKTEVKARRAAGRLREKRLPVAAYQAGSHDVHFSLPESVAAHFVFPRLPRLRSDVSERDLAQTNPQSLFSSAAFEIHSSVPSYAVFHFVPEKDQAPKQVSYVPPNIDWYRVFLERGDLSFVNWASANWDTSAR